MREVHLRPEYKNMKPSKSHEKQEYVSLEMGLKHLHGKKHQEQKTNDRVLAACPTDHRLIATYKKK